MCGILCVKSRRDIPLERHQAALSTMSARGPDMTIWQYQNRIFIGQTVLHFAGSTDIYSNTTDSTAIVFNGEIYDYQHHGDWDSDTRLIKHLVDNCDWQSFKQVHGPWAWIWTDFHSVKFATDPQHERHLWLYQDDDIMIISSEIAAIGHYVNLKIALPEWNDKHLPIQEITPWQNVVKIRPGHLYIDGYIDHDMITLQQWINESQTFSGTFEDAVDSLDKILTDVCESMAKTGPHSISFSGGLDSSLLQTYFPDAEPVTVIMGDKDPIALAASGIPITEQQWAEAYQQVVDKLYLPPLSWSWVSFHLVAQHSQHRAIISGVGADELFGGYPYNLSGDASPYHPDTVEAMITDKRQDSLIQDYIFQAGGVDLLGLDLVAGLNSREARAPFVHPRVIRFAMSLPYDYKVAGETKRILRALYRCRTGREYQQPKLGFAGHCNDSIPYIRPNYVARSAGRNQAWKQFILDDFAIRNRT